MPTTLAPPAEERRLPRDRSVPERDNLPQMPLVSFGDEPDAPRDTLGARSEGRRNNLDFLRFVLAALVILAHSCQLLPNRHVYDPFTLLSHGQMDSGALAVNGFFVISGFLITASWMRSHGLFDYLRKRALRMYPAVAVMSLLCLFVVGPLGTNNLGTYWHNLSLVAYLRKLVMLNVPHLPGMFAQHPGSHGVNEAMWTLRYEFGCYLLVAGLGLSGLLRKPRAVVALFVAFLAAWGWQAGMYHPAALPAMLLKGSTFEPWPRLGTYFLAGAAMYLYRYHIPMSRRLTILAAVAFVASLWGGLHFTMPIAGAYLLMQFAFSRRIPLQNFGKRGDLSYGIYLYGWPVQQLIIEYTRSWIMPQTLFPLALLGAIALAAMSWHFVEKPCLRWKKPARKDLPATEVRKVAVPISWTVSSGGTRLRSHQG